jgi:hypothetical protein
VLWALCRRSSRSLQPASLDFRAEQILSTEDDLQSLQQQLPSLVVSLPVPAYQARALNSRERARRRDIVQNYRCEDIVDVAPIGFPHDPGGFNRLLRPCHQHGSGDLEFLIDLIVKCPAGFERLVVPNVKP